jgi:hypothetical protein
VRGFRSRHRLRTALGSDKGSRNRQGHDPMHRDERTRLYGYLDGREAFESSDLGTKSVLCPDCGQEHTWDKDDAELEDE